MQGTVQGIHVSQKEMKKKKENFIMPVTNIHNNVLTNLGFKNQIVTWT